MRPSDQSRTPRFRKIIDDLRARIVGGNLLAHAPLPSERELAETYDVSRMTARRALEALEVEGLAYAESRRGRFVSPQRVTYDISKTISFAASAKAKGIALEISVVDAERLGASDAIAERLGVKSGTPIFRYTRLFKTGHHPILIETEHVLAERCPDFLDHDLRQSTSRLIETEYGIAASAGDIVIRLRSIDNGEAKLLGLTSSQAAIELTQLISDQSGAPFCFGRQLWRGELAEFTATALVRT